MACKAGVHYVLHAYEHQPGVDSFGMEAAHALGLDPRRVLKTLIARLDERVLAVAMVPVDQQLNLKALAALLGAKRAELADPTAAQRSTGYVLGGISPLGQKNRLPSALDESALEHETVFVSAGRRGLEIELAPADLARLTEAATGQIAGER